MASDKTSNMAMPALFIGHGSPMNAIQENSFTKMLNKIVDTFPAPKAILVISAHWMTRGTYVLGMDKPKTIHDFYGFPEELYRVEYPALGAPALAQDVCSLIKGTSVQIDSSEWGLDHGTWAVIRHMYPKANIPVIQLSLDMTKPAEYHYKLGQELQSLREKGVLILGSGNIVHNLRMIKWDTGARPYDWALEFDEWSKKNLEARNVNAFLKEFNTTEAGRLSVPTPDHYYPMLYILGAGLAKDELRFDYEEMQNASISMRAFSFRRS